MTARREERRSKPTERLTEQEVSWSGFGPKWRRGGLALPDSGPHRRRVHFGLRSRVEPRIPRSIFPPT